ncbi:DExH-box ATP-dependent RNA helicase DExH11 isoform X1 [Nymphaea colorata]|uniref:DExH-box ATP-dependent RNA helicase DExH11 isoform X1 n=1 Tax=Nymphaea colorata TaxID=210225 RepID=UPI00129E072A|nr:DExH-box ATP-dependent RNA helicase DExH11 isoform X1 [Nymphaea colorata]
MDRIEAVKGLPFRIGYTGHSGHLRIEPLPPVDRPNPLSSLPDLVLPPAFEPISEETIRKDIEEKYLTPRLDDDLFSPAACGRQWDFDWFDRYRIELDPTMPRTVVVPSWEPPFRRNNIKNAEEDAHSAELWIPDSVEIEMTDLLNGEGDFASVPRLPGPAKDFVRGTSGNRPFRPGGLEQSQSSERVIPEGALNGEWVREVLDGGPPQTIPPGFKQGLDLGPLKAYDYSWKIVNTSNALKKPLDGKTTNLSLQFESVLKRVLEQDVAEQENNDGKSLEVKSVISEAEVGIGRNDASSAAESVVLDDILFKEHEVTDQKVEGDTLDGQGKEVWAVTGGSREISNRFYELVPDMALEFPFELDTFQKEAIYYLEKGESVFVAAHTSAGKTVVAEYAFALASKHCTRAVYTAPIKTISNQKYRDFCGKFDVGLLTGDISLRPEASCLIMTTEILRSMLYRGADIIRDIEWVIFDEVHYVNDVERGVVWEEVIIMLPRHVNIILLSATVPNTLEFADWIGRTKQKKIRLTGTSRRPVPLEHCLFYSGELYKVCENEQFLPQGFKAAKDAYKKKNAVKPGAGSSGGSSAVRRHQENPNHGKTQKLKGPPSTGNVSRIVNFQQNSLGLRRTESSPWLTLITKLLKKSLLPAVIFCFSKNRCDKSADCLASADYTTSSEKSEIRVFCDKAFSRLKGSDRNLPQIVRVQNLLRRGIGVHHAGLLPIVKEVIEMLFCRGFIKVLFSTETFAMGVNAPARTVVFDSLRKFDGKEFRQLLPGEYTQMAGRAGRRGLDNIGTVIVICRDDVPDETNLKRVMVGSPTRLESQFRLTYIMILHLLRVEELKVEDMLKRSFAEFHAQKKLPEKQQLLLLKLSQAHKPIDCINCEGTIEEYYTMCAEVEKLGNRVSEAIMQCHTAQQFLSPGRVVAVRSHLGEEHLLGVVLKSPSASNKCYIVLVLKAESPSTSQTDSNSDVVSQAKESGNVPQGYYIAPKGKRGGDEEYFSSVVSRKGTGAVNINLPYSGKAAGVNYEVVGVESNDMLIIYKEKLKIDQVRLLEDVSPAAYSKAVQQLLLLKTDGRNLPSVDPYKDLKIKDVHVAEDYQSLNMLLAKISQSRCSGCTKLREHILLLKEQHKHREEVNALRYQMSDEALQQMPDFQGRIDVLKEIGCIDDDLVVQIKGRVACEMNSGEELISTECLFENQLDDLEPAEAVALMSALVFQQTNTSEPSLTPKLARARQRLFETAIKLGELQAFFKLAVNPEDYARDNLKFGLMEVVYEWAKGSPFVDICQLTDVPEGLIVRTIVRLDETCREFKNAAAIMGNSGLYKKMEAASEAIKRDIVFAASLYVTGI